MKKNHGIQVSHVHGAVLSKKVTYYGTDDSGRLLVIKYGYTHTHLIVLLINRWWYVIDRNQRGPTNETRCRQDPVDCSVDPIIPPRPGSGSSVYLRMRGYDHTSSRDGYRVAPKSALQYSVLARMSGRTWRRPDQSSTKIISRLRKSQCITAYIWL